MHFSSFPQIFLILIDNFQVLYRQLKLPLLHLNISFLLVQDLCLIFHALLLDLEANHFNFGSLDFLSKAASLNFHSLDLFYQ